MNATLKSLMLTALIAVILSACTTSFDKEDDADSFVGTYNVSVVEHVVWGNDSGTLTNTGTLMITKLSASRVQTSGFFRTQGEVTGKSVYFEAIHSSGSDGYTDDVFGPGFLNGNVLTVTGNSTGQLKYNGTLYPYRRTAEITAIKQN